MMVNELEFPLRTNVSFALSKFVKSQVLQLNSMIVSAGYCEIDFSAAQPPIPHITLLMGEVESPEKLKNLLDRLRLFSASVMPFDYTTGEPYLAPPAQQFVFMDTDPQDSFQSLRVRLHELIGDVIDCEIHGRPTNPSHITIGYVDQGFRDLDKLRRFWLPAAGTASVLQVAQVGNRGTCQAVIARIRANPRFKRHQLT